MPDAVISKAKCFAIGSKKWVVLNRRLIQSLHEGLGAIRDVLLDGSQPFYSNQYELSDRPLRKIVASNNFTRF